uniref:Solute carrier organic anion transporter family member n=1 Tax=Scleropages formosus TaxID=113540 RepID=A0A8D0CJV0_SCLFO
MERRGCGMGSVEHVQGEGCHSRWPQSMGSVCPALIPWCPLLRPIQMFIVALSFAFFSKALSGTYMKSSITQIERRFDLSSSLIGIVDAGFEIGNLLFLAAVSHFGAQLHRPRLIAAGCALMAVGSALTALPHFFMGQYKYDTLIKSSSNDSVSITPCLESGKQLRHLENHMRPACLQTITLLGPMFGFLLGSMCARLYVDIGFVNVDSVTITPKDTRWVGAWWLGFFVSSAIMLLAAVPFWFLPRSLPKQGEEMKDLPEPQHLLASCMQNDSVLHAFALGFFPSLKKLVCTPTYFLLLCGSVLKFNSFIGLLTFKAKYMEQQFGQSASRANFLIGVTNLPAVAVGIFLGGVLMKRYKLSVVSGAQLSLATSFAAYLLVITQFGIKCENLQVAGITVFYNGTLRVSSDSHTLFSPCNDGCSCSGSEWDPVCSENSITYTSPCLAGCISSSGFGKNTVFHNCSCVQVSPPLSGSLSVSIGQCPRSETCSSSFTTYMTVSVLSSFINSLGATPGYMVIIRCIAPELKSLALGIQTLAMRALGGIPAPVYFGALIDLTCLKWGTKKCGGRGALFLSLYMCMWAGQQMCC